MGRSIAAHPAAGRHLGDDGFCHAVGPNFVSQSFEFRALAVMAEFGTWPPPHTVKRPENEVSEETDLLASHVVTKSAGIHAPISAGDVPG